MPNLDQTGPTGQGPQTGGGFGRCGSKSRQPMRQRNRQRRNVRGVGRGGRPWGGGRGRCFGGGRVRSNQEEERGLRLTQNEVFNDSEEEESLLEQIADLTKLNQELQNRIRQLESTAEE